MTLKFVSRLFYLATTLAWIFICAHTYIWLVGEAADSPEVYTRTATFQAINFVWQYLPGLLISLLVVLLAEWAVFAVCQRLSRSAVQAHVGGEGQ